MILNYIVVSPYWRTSLEEKIIQFLGMKKHRLEIPGKQHTIIMYGIKN